MVDDADDLTLIPRGVRDKLDRVGIKLHLRQWDLFERSERVFLRDSACETRAEVDAYRRRLDEMVVRHTGRPADRLGTKAPASTTPSSA